MRNTCDQCGQEFDDARNGTWRKIEGYVVERAGGGANTVREKRYLGPVKCPECGKLRDLGVRENQQRLL